MYSPDNITTFKINGIKYTIHNHILSKMHIFTDLLSDNIDSGSMFEIEYPVSEDIVSKIFDVMYYPQCVYFSSPNTVKYALDIISYMKYLCIDINIINSTIKNIVDNKTIDKFIDECKDILYHADLLCIYDNIDTWYSGTIDSLIDKITSLNFPIEFTIHILEKEIYNIIYKAELDFKLAIDYIYCKDKMYTRINELFDTITYDNNTATLNEIINTYSKYGIIINSHIIHFEKHTVTKFIVNNKEVPISKYNRPFQEGIIGINFADTIACHITKILLGLETLD
jgi:hypothetical protein